MFTVFEVNKLSATIKSMEIKNISDEQTAELMDIVEILDTGAIAFEVEVYGYNLLLDSKFRNENVIQLMNNPLIKDKRPQKLIDPTLTELVVLLETLITTATKKQLIEYKESITKLKVVEDSVLKAIRYLATLKYVTEEPEPKILLN